MKLTVADSARHGSKTKENYIVVLSEGPFLLAVDDIPEDQGGWVEVKFYRSVYDTDSLHGTNALSAELYTVEIADSNDWVAAATTLAYGKTLYKVLVPTPADFIPESERVLKFRVIAGMQEGTFVSNTAKGYSIDNLPPAVPEGLDAVLKGSNQVGLSWNKSSDIDLNYYNIYRNTEDYFDDSSRSIWQTTGTEYVEEQVQPDHTYYYAIRSVDHSENESGFSRTVSINITPTLSIDRGNTIPHTFYIDQNYPNPFNPVPSISYGLPRATRVGITIYDIMGREVIRLVDGKQDAGRYHIRWNGSDRNGRQVASGIYFYKIDAGDFIRIHKMILMK